MQTLEEKMHITKAENDEKDLIIGKLQQELSQINEISEKTKREVAETKGQLDESCKQKDNELNMLRFDLEQKDKEFQEKILLITELEQSKNNIIKENDKLKMELSSKSFDLENASDKVLELENQLKAASDDLDKFKSCVNEKNTDFTQYQEQQQAAMKNLSQALEKTQQSLREKLEEIAELKEKSQAESKLKDQKIDEVNQEVSRHKRDLEKLNIELADTKSLSEKKEIEMANIHSTQIASQDLQLKTLSTEVQQKSEEMVKLQIVVNKLEEDICTKNSLIEKFRLEKEEIENRCAVYAKELQDLQQQMNDLTLNHGDIQRQLVVSNERIVSLQEVKQRLEVEIAALTTKCENPEQVQQLRTELMIKEQALDGLRSEFEQKIQFLERAHHELELKHEQSSKEWNKQQQDLIAQSKISATTEIELRAQIDNYAREVLKMREESQIAITNLEQSVNEKTHLLENLEVKYSQNEKLQETQLMAVKEEMNRNIQNYQEKITTLTDETTFLKNELNAKSEQIIELNAKCGQLLADAKQYQTDQKQNFDETINKLQLEINEKNMQMNTLNVQLQKDREESRLFTDNLQEKLIKDAQIHNTELISLKKEMASNVQSYEEKISNLVQASMHLKEELNVKSNQIEELNNKCSQLQADVHQNESEQKKNFEESIHSLQLEINEKNVQLNKLTAELQLAQETCQTTATGLQTKDKEINELTTQNHTTQTLITQLQKDLNQFKLLSDQKCKEQETTQIQYKSLLDQVGVLEGKLKESESCMKNLQIEHNNAVELMTYLSVTQNQKEHCMKQLVNDSRHCKYVQELLDQMTVNVDQNEEKVLVLQKEVEHGMNRLGECNIAYEQQKSEVIRLQELLSKVNLFCI